MQVSISLVCNTRLTCRGQPLCGLRALEWLDIAGNLIPVVSLSDLPALKELDLRVDDRLRTVSLTGLTALESLDLSRGRIANLSLSGLTLRARGVRVSTHTP